MLWETHDVIYGWPIMITYGFRQLVQTYEFSFMASMHELVNIRIVVSYEICNRHSCKILLFFKVIQGVVQWFVVFVVSTFRKPKPDIRNLKHAQGLYYIVQMKCFVTMNNAEYAFFFHFLRHCLFLAHSLYNFTYVRVYDKSNVQLSKCSVRK